MADKKYDLDSSQKKAVAVDVNAVVSAGAGSGKTSVLAKRFADILKRDSDCKVEQILTLTFTKKATVEMNGRIYKELSEKCPDKAKDFYKANIKTLDSYCSQVARLGCRFYGLTPDFVIDADKVSEKVSQMALPFILKHRNNKAIKALANTKSFDNISKELFASPVLEYGSVAEKINFYDDYEKQKNEVCREWKKTAKKIEVLWQTLKDEAENFEGNKNTKFFSSMSEFLQEELSEIPEIDFNESVSESRNKFLEPVKNVCELSLKGAVKGIEEIKETVKSLRSQFEIISSLENFIYGNQYVVELLPLLEEFQNSVNEMKVAGGIISYSDASSLAMKILLEHPEIRQIEKEKYKYIMIDEFQDNNKMQRDLLFLLAEKKDRREKSIPNVNELEKNKLFFVGDEKQSIYLFRGADVSVFRSLSNDFKDGNLELKTNYRSHPALIAAFNAIFGGADYPPSEHDRKNLSSVFFTEKQAEQKEAEKDSVPEYEAVYHDVTFSDDAVKKIGADKKIFEPRVQIALYNKDNPVNDDEFDADNCEAMWVAKKIKQLIAEENYSPNDIAILFRSYSQLPVYEKILLNEGIPFVSETVKGFFADGPVNDIMSILRLAAYPTDILSFVNVLRSPFANLSSLEINFILSEFDNSRNCFEQDVEKLLSEKSFKKFLFAKCLYQKINELLQTENLTEIISFLWYDAGYRYETLWNNRVFMYNSIYDKLFELARQADLNSTGLVGFVDAVDIYKDEQKKLDGMEIPLESSDGVNILSIHKSKGLEYPVVFVCSTGHAGKVESNSDTVYVSKEFGITVNTPLSPVSNCSTNYFYEKQKSLAEKKAAAELRRLTYVALTRAEKKLFITGSCEFSKIGEIDFSAAGNTGAEIKNPKKIIQVLMPAISSFVNNEGKIDDELQKKCPFIVEEILHQKKITVNSTVQSVDKIKEKFLPLYQKTKVVKKDVVPEIYILPSKLYEDDEILKPEQSLICADKEIPYYEIDELVKDSISNKNFEPEFTYANFGSIMHACMEAAIKNEKFLIPNSEIIGLHGRKNKINEIEKICEEIKSKFLSSSFGKKVLRAVQDKKICKTEFAFRSLLCNKIVNGQIDLLFEDAETGCLVVADYKTNRYKNPELYYNQLSCYRQAVSKMFGISAEKVKCSLFYLRYGEEVDITEHCSETDLEKYIQSME